MKKINDTYSSLSGKPVKIALGAEIKTENEKVRNIIGELKKGDSGVLSIEFRPFGKDARKLVNDTFQSAEEIREGGYVISVSNSKIDVYTTDRASEIYAAYALVRHYSDGIPSGVLYNNPLVPFRAVKTYVPGRGRIVFFKELLDMCAYYGFNTVVMEVGGAMEYERHPEINEGWEEYSAIFREYNSKAADVQRCMPWNKDSIHWENGEGSYITKKELRDIVLYARELGIEIMPEIPSLSHSDYLLTRHPELAENVADPIPDSYCPNNPDVYNLLFDVIDEVIEVFEPKTVHIAHDEWYSACMCDKCRGKDPTDLFASDVNKIYEYITARGIKVMMWGDMIVRFPDQNGYVRGAGISIAKIPTARTVTLKGRTYNVFKELWYSPAERLAALGGNTVFHAPNTERAIDMIPKDITMMNWLHHYNEDSDLKYIDKDIPTVYGNFYPRSFKNWFHCIERGVHGACISNWSMLDRNHMQRMGILFGIGYMSLMMWNRDFDENAVNENTFAVAHDLFEYSTSRDFGNYSAEIIHGSSEKIPHEIFWDGRTIDYANDRMGAYKIDYADGTEELLDIYYGCNIGVIHSADYNPKLDPNGTNTHILEATYTCDYFIESGLVYYKLKISRNKKIVNITPQIEPKYTDSVKILKITI